MTAKEAAVLVLREANEPLHINEITERIVAQKLWQPSGQTPVATLHAQLAVDIKKKGTASFFRRTAPSTFGLQEWGGIGKDERILNPNPRLAGSPNLPARQTVTFIEAAENVLEKFSHKRPMYYKDIADKVMELGLVHTEGKTPEATLYAQILTDISRRSKRGDPLRFTKHGRLILEASYLLPVQSATCCFRRWHSIRNSRYYLTRR